MRAQFLASEIMKIVYAPNISLYDFHELFQQNYLNMNLLSAEHRTQDQKSNSGLLYTRYYVVLEST